MMRPAEEKSCTNFVFQKNHGGNKVPRNRGMIQHTQPKLAPSKWDDAQKWLVGLSGGGSHSHSKAKPRNSNADDRRLLNSASQRERYSCSSAEGLPIEEIGLALSLKDESETKKIDYGEPQWNPDKPMDNSSLAVRSVCVRDMGTEMTPTVSQEPSRAATPIRAATPVLRSPMSSRSSTPGKCRQGSQPSNHHQEVIKNSPTNGENVFFGMVNSNGWSTRGSGDLVNQKNLNSIPKQVSDPSSLESRAMAWDEAERAKYMTRYKREEMKIQAWENHEKRKAETTMRKKEVKVERIKARAREKMANKLAAARRIAEEKRATAEAKLSEQAARTAERADYIRRTGHLPSNFFSFKLPSLCG